MFCSYVGSMLNWFGRFSSAEGNGIIMSWYPNIMSLSAGGILIVASYLAYSTKNIKWLCLNVTYFAGLSAGWVSSPVWYCTHKKPSVWIVPYDRDITLSPG